MGEVSTIGLDIAKSVFQVHGVDVAGAVVIRKRVRSQWSGPRTDPWRQCLARGYARRSAIPGWAAPAV
jgi:hypothetical protein